ncbi:MAG TPA: tRNA threonylcarbamoyladenosine dehydratase [Candidatus Gastranaerophilaceae bacterium]|nr:tRNA threonylcarbamoyladenosine dehydratase [Candidatus Gastranaerophilaceae bacterium]HPT42088.1 tRNA threonylcarbamoyladenosine dehydratase [Candidatus Gastranaerophilaceae bacterium]
MNDIFSRNELYWGKEGQKKLSESHIIVFGLGGVGGYCVEMLARAGIGELTLVDFDKVSVSNINRQIVALNSTLGQEKTTLFEKRLKDINPEINVHLINDFYTESLNSILIGKNIDFIADAIDTIRSKVSLLEFAYTEKFPVISSFGAGNRVNPEGLYICDISKIKNKKTPFISNIIHQLKLRNINEGIMVVTSDEKPMCQNKILNTETVETQRGEKIEYTKITPASTPFVASAAGIFMASHIVQELTKKKKK